MEDAAPPPVSSCSGLTLSSVMFGSWAAVRQASVSERDAVQPYRASMSSRESSPAWGGDRGRTSGLATPLGTASSVNWDWLNFTKLGE